MGLIDADALMKEIKELENGLIELLSTHSADDWVGSRERFIILTELEDIKIFKETIEEAPTVERPRGEWISEHHIKYVGNTYKTSYNIYTCSICKIANGKRKDKFCRFCGADMRGEGE